MEEKLEKTSLEITSFEYAVKTAVSLAGCAPLVNLYQDYKNTIQINNMVDVINSHTSQLSMLKEMVISEMYLHSPERIKDLLETLQKAKDETNMSKKELFATYLTACCHINNGKSLNKRIFLDLLGSIDKFDFFIIKTISESSALANIIKKVLTENEETNAITETDVEIHLDYLISLRLIEEFDEDTARKIYPRQMYGRGTRNLFGRKPTYYRLTNLGKELLKFISIAE